MILKYKKIKKYGSSEYYLSEDKKFFIKTNSSKKEYQNLKKYWNKIKIKNLRFIEPVEFSEKEKILITKYENAPSLINISNPKIYYKFGKKLKEFHNSGFSHSHLQFNDVLYKKEEFILTDLGNLNEKDNIIDLVKLKLSLNLFRLKKPWLWKRYTVCFKSFIKGYNFKEKDKMNKEYEKWINNRIDNLLKKNSFLSKIKGYILKINKKMGLLK
ncbi:hypothetical protein JW949_01300 [Candidatus Woesearchaeota archaeon]|nr:hypothetical protein [Candidatus Woesearchaeota archaeon]